jgi:alkaline phosphatase D
MDRRAQAEQITSEPAPEPTVHLLLAVLACSPTPERVPPDSTATLDDSDTDVPVDPRTTLPSPSVRFATFNTSLYGLRAGDVAASLDDPSWSHAVGVASILQRVRPDVVLLNEIDADQAVVERLRDGFLAVSQDGLDPLDYPYVYVAPSNTGVHSGIDLNGDGVLTPDREGTDDYANDSFGYGVYEGQYGFAVLSRYPLDTPRTFQTFLWADLPDNQLPTDFYSDEA